MDPIASEAVATLTTAVTSLLPPPVDPSVPHAVLVTPLRIATTGLGGFVGLNPDPQGEIFGRRIRARVDVNVGALTATGLDSALAHVTSAVMTTGREELSQLGILKLGVLELGPQPDASAAPPAAARRAVSFNVLYEFLKLPVQAGGVIQTIPLDIDSTLAVNDPRVLLRGPFLPPSLDLFEVFDDNAATTASPSAWSFDTADAAIIQTADITGGANAPTPDKPGTYCVLRTTPVRPPLRDFTMAAEVLTTSPGGIGMVFRFVDVNNFYFALLDSRNGFRMLGKKVAGVFGALQSGGLDAAAGFSAGTLVRVRLVAQGDEFRLLIDGRGVLDGRDDELAAGGRVGFLTRHCTGARFFDLMLVRL